MAYAADLLNENADSLIVDQGIPILTTPRVSVIVTDPTFGSGTVSQTGTEQLPLATTADESGPNITDIAAEQAIREQAYWDEMSDRYNKLKGLSAEELAKLGIWFQDGSYYIGDPVNKTGKTYLAYNAIMHVLGYYDLLTDSDGNYIYAMDIPQDVMVATLLKYKDSGLTKEQLEDLARQAYALIAAQYGDVQDKVSLATPAVEQAAQNNIAEGTPIGATIQQLQEELQQKLGSYWYLWLIAAVVILFLIIYKLRK